MRIDRIAADLGLAHVPEEERSALLFAASKEAEDYIRARCPIPWAEWQLLSEVTQAAFIEAGDRIRREEAALVALALRSPSMMQAMLAGRDIEDAAVGEAVSKIGDRIAAGLGSAG